MVADLIRSTFHHGVFDVQGAGNLAEVVAILAEAAAGAVCVLAGPVTTAAALAGGELAGAGAEVPRNTTYDAPAVSPALRSAASSAMRNVDC